MPNQRARSTGEGSQQQPLGRCEVDRDTVAVGEASIKVDDERVGPHKAMLVRLVVPAAECGPESGEELLHPKGLVT